MLYLISSYASRKSHRFADRSGGSEPASRLLWMITILFFLGAAGALWRGWDIVAVACFVFIVILQNIWRPILMSRIDEVSDAKMGATILSIDSQAGSFYVMIFAPLLGFAVDRAGLWPVAAFGGVMALIVLATRRRSTES